MTSRTRPHLTSLILAALVLGSLTGLACHAFIAQDRLGAVYSVFDLMSRVFLRLIKMLIGPLVLCMLIGGIGRLQSESGLGKLAAKALLLFILASIVSLSLAAAAAIYLEPGVGVHLSSADSAPATLSAHITLSGFIEHIVPTSIFEALASNEVLQIVVFSIFAGLALAKLGPAGQTMAGGLEQLTRLMLKIAELVMRFAPVGVFGASAAVFTLHGLAMVKTYATLLGEFYTLLALICLLLLAMGFITLGRRVLELLIAIRQPVLIAFSTGSSEVAYPKLLQAAEGFGVPPAAAALVLPLGYAFNLVGSMAYCGFATLFVAQAADVTLSGADVALMLTMLLVMSKGIGNVPRASIAVIATILPYFKIPDAGIALLLGVDQLLDMGRTGVNVVANAIAAAVVAKWENRLGLRSPVEWLVQHAARPPTRGMTRLGLVLIIKSHTDCSRWKYCRAIEIV